MSEVKRDVAKQLGINLGAVFNVGTTNLLQFANSLLTDAFPLTGIDASFSFGGNQVSAAIRALEGRGALRILAQPALTAISGEAATFLAGGDMPHYPYEEADNGTCATTALFKPYDVELSFTPVVKSNGTISLKVVTSASEPQADLSITKRQASTSVELPSGTTLAIGGLLEEKSKQQIN
ncbi:MAG: hypothetical protein MO852_04600 [Candidatus Devosia euplotis]|nr:hypothetical protein [Candidatus Devosia euplotis]